MRVFRVSKVDLRKASVVVSTEEVSANAFHALILQVFLLSDGEIAEGVDHRQTSNELDFPLVLGESGEQILLASNESGT
jgi:fructose-1,6-bisphosphatase/sedoheptulose 1,7-bisphosphatase-like protein